MLLPGLSRDQPTTARVPLELLAELSNPSPAASLYPTHTHSFSFNPEELSWPIGVVLGFICVRPAFLIHALFHGRSPKCGVDDAQPQYLIGGRRRSSREEGIQTWLQIRTPSPPVYTSRYCVQGQMQLSPPNCVNDNANTNATSH